MKKNMLLTGALMLMMASCSNDENFVNEVVKDNTEPALTIIATQGDADSRLAFEDEQNLAWTPGDQILVTAAENPADYVLLTLQETEQTKTGTFSTTTETTEDDLAKIEAWKSGNTPLVAYYKNDGFIYEVYNGKFTYMRVFDAGYIAGYDQPIYAGQIANDNYDHLAKLNHLTSKESFTIPSDNSAVNLKFGQMGAIMKLTLSGLEGKTVTKLTLGVAYGDRIFQSVTSVNGTDVYPIMNPSVSLPLGESGGGITLDDDETLIAYMAMGPTEATEGKVMPLTATTTDGEYIATVTGGKLEAGNIYSVSKTMALPMGDKTADEAEKGDLAMADGTFISKDDIAALTEEQKDNVRGIVFWTEGEEGNATLASDVIMQTKYPNCTHGLIVSLTNVSDGCIWQSSYASVAAWQNNNSPYNGNGYKSISTGTGPNEHLNSILGYQNTEILKAYNASLASGSVNTVLPVSSLESWKVTNPAPANTTGWFIPSEKELTMLCGKDVDHLWENNSGGTDTKVAMNSILTSLGIDNLDALADNNYWSSQEHLGNAFFVDFNGGFINSNQRDAAFYLRAVCAF